MTHMNKVDEQEEDLFFWSTSTTTTSTIKDAGGNEYEVVVKTLPYDEIERAAYIMAYVFHTSKTPSYTYIFSNPKGRIDNLTWLFTRNLHAIYKKCPTSLKGIYLMKDDNAEEKKEEEDSRSSSSSSNDTNKKLLLIGAFVWAHVSSDTKLTMWDMVKGGLWLIPFKFGLQTYQRLMHTINWFDNMNEKIYCDNTNDNDDDDNKRPTVKMIRLERMVVLPEYQGRNVGTIALRQVMKEEFIKYRVLKESKKSKSELRVKIRLETQAEINAKFYNGKLGLHVIQEKQEFKGLNSTSDSTSDATTEAEESSRHSSDTTTANGIDGPTTGAIAVSSSSSSSSSPTNDAATDPKSSSSSPVLYYSWFMEREI